MSFILEEHLSINQFGESKELGIHPNSADDTYEEKKKQEIKNFISQHPKGHRPSRASRLCMSCRALPSSVVDILQFMLSKSDNLANYAFIFYSEYYAN